MEPIANIYIVLIVLLGIDIGVTTYGLVREIKKKRRHLKKRGEKE